MAAIYRGCFDAFKAVKQLTDDYLGCRNQTWNNRVRRWCLCDTDLCNRFPIEQNYQRLPSISAYRRVRNHHHPLPPPQPAPSKNLIRDSGAETAAAFDGEVKGVQPTSYRTVWTNWKAVPASRRHGQQTDRRLEDQKKKGNDGSRTQGNLGHVVSHSVYPDQWKANVEAFVDRRHAKSSENIVSGRPEPLSFSDEGQMSRSNYSAPPRRVQQYEPPNEESQIKSMSAADRQSARGRFTHEKNILLAVDIFKNCNVNIILM